MSLIALVRRDCQPMEIHWSCSCRCHSTNRIGDFWWAWHGNESTRLFVPQSPMTHSCSSLSPGTKRRSVVGSVSSFSLGHSLHCPQNYSQSHFSSEQYFNQIYHPRAKSQNFSLSSTLHLPSRPRWWLSSRSSLHRGPIGEPSGLRFSDRVAS
jgi:hypothetical protein